VAGMYRFARAAFEVKGSSKVQLVFGKQAAQRGWFSSKADTTKSIPQILEFKSTPWDTLKHLFR